MIDEIRASRERIQSLLSVRRWSEAADLARQALASDPDDAYLHCLLSKALLGLEDWNGALEAAEEALRLQPDLEWPHRLRGAVYNGLDMPNEAVAAVREAMALDPEIPYTHAELARLLLWVAHGSNPKRRRELYAEARAEAHAAIELDAGYGYGYVALGYVDLATKQLDAAQRHAEEALAIDPEDGESHLLLGHIAKASGRHAEAADHWVAAGAIDPTDERPLEHLRRSRWTLPAIGLVGFGVLRVLRSGEYVGWWLAVAVGAAIVVGYLAYVLVLRRKRQRELSDRARQVLEIDKQVNRRSWRRR